MTETLTNEAMHWIGVDFDQTIAHNSGFPDFVVSRPIKGTKLALNKLVKKGYKIIIYTARPWSEYQLIETWLNKHTIPFRRIVCGKILVRWMIDDKNIEFDGNWTKTLKRLEELDG